MKTEELNGYLFTKLVDDFAQRIRSKRLEAEFEALGNDDPVKINLENFPLTDEDIKKGFDLLLKRHQTVSELLKGLQPELPAAS